jgi:hypothetical protein
MMFVRRYLIGCKVRWQWHYLKKTTLGFYSEIQKGGLPPMGEGLLFEFHDSFLIK